MRKFGGFIINQFKYLFAGLVTWLPVGIVLFVIVYAAGLMENLGQTVFDFFISKMSEGLGGSFSRLFLGI